MGASGLLLHQTIREVSVLQCIGLLANQAKKSTNHHAENALSIMGLNPFVLLNFTCRCISVQLSPVTTTRLFGYSDQIKL